MKCLPKKKLWQRRLPSKQGCCPPVRSPRWCPWPPWPRIYRILWNFLKKRQLLAQEQGIFVCLKLLLSVEITKTSSPFKVGKDPVCCGGSAIDENSDLRATGNFRRAKVNSFTSWTVNKHFYFRQVDLLVWRLPGLWTTSTRRVVFLTSLLVPWTSLRKLLASASPGRGISWTRELWPVSRCKWDKLHWYTFSSRRTTAVTRAWC